MRIRLKLALLVAGTLFVLLPFISYVYYLNVERTFLDGLYSHLESISEAKAIRLDDITEKRYEIVSFISTQPLFVRILENKSPDISPDIKMNLISLFKRYKKALKSFKDINITSSEGIIVVSTDSSNVGLNFSDRICFTKSINGSVFWGDFHLDKQHKLNTFLSAPIYDSALNILGTLIIGTDASEIQSLTSDYTGLGETGETVIGIKDGATTLINSLRFNNKSIFNKRLNPKDSMIPMNMALEGVEGIMKEGKDYRTTEVIASTRYINKVGWGMVTKIDKEEAFIPVLKLMWLLVTINIIGILATFVIAYFVSGKLSEPIEVLTETVNKIKEGDFSERVMVTTSDEIGALASSFNQMAANLERKIADIDNFAYTAAHDLKAPIANLEGLLYVLKKTLEGKIDEKEIALLQMFELTINKFKNTINDLGEITKAQLNTSLDVQLVIFEEIFEEVRLNIKNLIDESSAQITVDFEVKDIVFSRKDMNSILHNLLTNAIKYRSLERTSYIKVATHRIDDKIVICVKDNGLGFDPIQKQKIFGMFKRMHTHVEGSGIGLYLLKRIVDNNGGNIEVESVPSQGSEFRIYLKG